MSIGASARRSGPARSFAAQARRRARDLAGSLLLAARRTAPSRACAGRLTVVTFHRVLPEAEREAYPLPGLVVTPRQLLWFLRFFREHFECAPLREAWLRFRTPGRSGRPLLAITFDDGQLDNFVHARPLLAEVGLRASFFVPVEGVSSGMPLWHDRLGFAAMRLNAASRSARRALAELGVEGYEAMAPRELARAAVTCAKRVAPEVRRKATEALELAAAGASVRPSWDGMMSFEQLAVLSAEGHEIGSHSMTHAILTDLSDAELEHEVASSRTELEKRLGVAVDSFCYPNGDWDARTVRAVEEAGYTRAVTTAYGTNDPDAPPLALRRCEIVSEQCQTVPGSLSAAQLSWRLSGRYPGVRHEAHGR